MSRAWSHRQIAVDLLRRLWARVRPSGGVSVKGVATKSLCAVLAIVALVYVASGKAPSIPSIAFPSINWTTIFAPSTPSVPVAPTTPTASAVVYVYEKDDGMPPDGVEAGISRLNLEGKIIASSFEQNTVNGDGQTPAQYVAPLAAAKKHGLPCLVTMHGETATFVTVKPTTEAHVMEAAGK